MGLHGIVVNQLATGERPTGVLSQSVIGIAGTAPSATGLDIGETKLVRGPSEVTALGLTTGTIKDALAAGLAQGRASFVVHRVDEGEDDTETQTNLAGDAGAQTGVYALLKAKAEVGVKPKILIAPGHSHVAGVHAALLAVAQRLLGVAIIDGENTDAADAITLAGGISDGNGYGFLVDPYVTVSGVAKPSSGYVAGLMAQVDQTEGFWVSPSNHTILGIDGTGRPISFELGDANCEAAQLNDEKIATIVREQGFRLWGNRTLATEPLYQFLCIRRTANAIAEAIQLNHLWAVDKGITRNLGATVVEGVNDFLRRMKAAGAIIDGSAWIDPELNTAGSLADGELYVDYDFTGVPPAESLNFNQRITTRYLSQLFA
jgi:phage tail sheath protein FI